MFIPTPFTTVGTPYAFLPATFAERPQGKYSIYAFWLAPKKSGNEIRLAFGPVSIKLPADFKSLSYADVLQEARNTPKLKGQPQNRTVESSPSAILEASSVWGSDYHKELHDALGKLLVAYPQLPSVPQGADGWYKLRS